VDINSAFTNPEELLTATLKLRDGRALNLRVRGKQISEAVDSSGWQRFAIEYRDIERFIEEVLWYGDDVIVEEPAELRTEVIKRLKEGVRRYG